MNLLEPHVAASLALKVVNNGGQGCELLSAISLWAVVQLLLVCEESYIRWYLGWKGRGV